MRALVLGVIAVLVVSFSTLSPSTVSAEPRLTSTPAVELEWPTQLHFRVSAESDVAITEVTLRYSLRDTGFSAFSRPRDFTPGTSVNVTVSIDVNTSAGYVPVGNTFDYVWEITDASGATFTSQPQAYLFLPPDGDWTSISSDLMVVHHLRGEEALARRFLDAAVETNADMGTLLGTTLPHTPVVAVLFEDRASMDVATTGSRVRETACGVRVSDTTIFLSPEPCGTFDETDTLRHEFTHLLVSAAAGPAAVPLWLNEGTAVTGQVAADTAYTGPFEQAVRTNRLYTFLEMQRSQNPSTRVELFYGQSYAMVQYLLQVGGPEKFAEYFAALKAGERYDVALEDVYGFDLDGFETGFREALGLPASNASPTPVVTRTPQRGATAVPTRAISGDSSGDDGGVSTITIAMILGAIMLGLLAVLLYLWVLVRSRQRSIAASAPPPPIDPPPPDAT